MQVSMAIAEKGFITTNDNPNFSASDNFLQTLQKIFPFQNVDILEFDGNSCQMINSYNPTNSIFIYTNEQGTFLYTITEATPRVHKNNFIWDCLCYKMEDMSKIESLVADGKVCEFQILKNIMPRKVDVSDNDRGKLVEFKVEEKNNFTPRKVIKQSFLEQFSCFKLKFSLNPLTEQEYQGLTSNDGDGSWTFFFPIFTNPANTSLDTFPLEKPTYQISWTNSSGNTVYRTMQQILKFHSANLMSIEFIPFFPHNGELGGSCDLTPTETTVEISNLNNVVATPAGLHFPYGHSIERTSFGVSFALDNQLIKGGGARGFVKLPNGEFPLDFNGFNQFEGLPSVFFLIKSEGWKIDGMFSADITPYYVNFKTDETSQLLIQNQTTNAQELRQLNRETEFKRTSSAINTASGLLGNVAGGIAGGLSGGPLGAVIGGVSAIGQTLFGGVSEQINISRGYSLAKANYDDKIKTQSLLASMTGKSVGGGNGEISSITNNFSKNDYMLIIETNFELSDYDYTYFWESIQEDYDYSVSMLNPQRLKNLILDRTGNEQDNDYTHIFSLLKNIFGFGVAVGEPNVPNYTDYVGLNYNLTFIIGARPTEFSESIANLDQTEILNFPIRHNTKIIS